MNGGLYRAASAMIGHERQLDAIAGNLANLGTVGYKRTTTAFHTALRGTPRVGQRPAQDVVLSSQVDFSQGELTRTGRDYDLALDGGGFFAVEAPQGERYTRDGSFQVSPDGVLVSGEGYPVAWDGGASTVDPAGLPVVVEGDGTVKQGDQQLGRLRIVDFVDRAALRRDRHGYWAAPPDLREAAHTATVHQYTLEDANTNGVEQIVDMIGVQRSFDSAARVMSSIDESYRRLVRPF